jgi:hypothetical protein
MTNNTNNDLFKIEKPQKFIDIFGKDSLNEEFNRSALKYMLINWNDFESKCIEYDNGENDSSYNPKMILERYLDRAKGSNIIQVKYKKSTVSKKYGRWFAEGSLSIQNMPRKVRHTICKGIWIDLDFKNCHPVILEQLCNNFGIGFEYLKKYNTDRDGMLKAIMDVNKCDKDKAKRCILKILNGSKLEVDVPYWGPIKTEFMSIANYLASKKEYHSLYKIVKDNKDKNVQASTMNSILCYFENLCLEEFYKFLQNKRVIIDNKCCLIFDGLQVADTPQNRALLTSEFLEKASIHIYKKTGLKLDIIIKEFDEAIDLPEGYENTFEDTYVIEQGDDKSAAEYVIKKYKHIIKKCNGRMFVCNDGVWISDKKQVKTTLKNLVSNLDIRKEGLLSTLVYSRNKKAINDCVDIILADDSYTDNTFVDKLFYSNLYYLAYLNGIWSFKDRKLYTYEELPDVHFTKRINRDFNKGDKKYMIDGVEQDLNYCKKLVYDKIINPILPVKEQRDYFLMCLSRALAGHFTDKKWYVAQGARDCGKGVLANLLEKAFQSYIGLFKSDNFLCTRVRVSGDEAKKLSWLVPLEFCRIALSSEISTGKDVKINGDLIKGFASGGDTQQARQNHKDEIDFKLQCMMFIYCNELVDVEPKDTLETLENFVFKSKFINEEKMNELKALNDDNLEFFKLSDSTIKTWCENDYVIDAFTSIIFDHYKIVRDNMPVIMIPDNNIARGENKESLEMVCTKIFMKTSSKSDVMTSDDIIMKIHSYTSTSGITDKMVKSTLARLNLGVYDRYRLHDGKQVRGYGFMKIRDTAQRVIDENDREND